MKGKLALLILVAAAIVGLWLLGERVRETAAENEGFMVLYEAAKSARAGRSVYGRPGPPIVPKYEPRPGAAEEVETDAVDTDAAPLTEEPVPAEEVAVAEAQVTQAMSAISALETQIEKMTLRSPIAGLVTSCSAHQGEAAIAGATLLSVADLDEVKLTVYIPEDKLARVYLGQQVEVQVDSFPGRAFIGTVSYISQQAEFTPRNVQTVEERVNMVFALRVRLPTPDHLLKPGMPADAGLDD